MVKYILSVNDVYIYTIVDFLMPSSLSTVVLGIQGWAWYKHSIIDAWAIITKYSNTWYIGMGMVHSITDGSPVEHQYTLHTELQLPDNSLTASLASYRDPELDSPYKHVHSITDTQVSFGAAPVPVPSHNTLFLGTQQEKLVHHRQGRGHTYTK